VRELLPQCWMQVTQCIPRASMPYSPLLYGLLQNGISPLFIAVQQGHTEVVQALLGGGAHVHQTNQVCAYQ